MYCPSCGQQLSDDTRFCWKCGADVQKVITTAPVQQPPTRSEEIARTPESVMSEQSLPRCPRCTQGDRIAKVTDIITRGTHQLSGETQEWVSEKDSGHWTTVPFSGTQMSELARKLVPPIKPQYSAGRFWYIMPWLALYPFLTWFAPISKSKKKLLALLLLAYFITWGISSIFTQSRGEGTATTGVLIAAIGFGGAFFVVYYIGLRENNARRRAEFEATEIVAWQKAMERWNRLYYCGRDDCVFDPITSEFTQPDQLKEMLYR